jgi:uncharacterized membrane protein YccC
MQWQCNFCVTKTRHILIQILLGILLAVLFGLGFGLFVMLLWNALLPDIWGWKEISYWQGVGLIILARLLFGSHGYHKEKNQSPAGCRENFTQLGTGGESGCGHRYDQRWLETEGEAALQQYQKKLAERNEMLDKDSEK